MADRKVHDRDHMRRAEEITAKILDKAKNALAPLELELSLLKMPNSYQAIIFDAVAQHANHLAAKRRA